MLEFKFTKPEEILRFKEYFNPMLMTPEYVAEVLAKLDSCPVTYNEDIFQTPGSHRGIVICRNCNEMFWVTRNRDACLNVEGMGVIRRGPFCSLCSYDIASGILEK